MAAQLEGPPPEDDLSIWVLTLRPLPDDVPAAVRMRRALKCLLRSFRLKCERISGKEPEGGPGRPSR